MQPTNQQPLVYDSIFLILGMLSTFTLLPAEWGGSGPASGQGRKPGESVEGWHQEGGSRKEERKAAWHFPVSGRVWVLMPGVLWSDGQESDLTLADITDLLRPDLGAGQAQTGRASVLTEIMPAGILVDAFLESAHTKSYHALRVIACNFLETCVISYNQGWTPAEAEPAINHYGNSCTIAHHMESACHHP